MLQVEKTVEYFHICHDECYLKGVIQETLDDPKLRECEAMDPKRGEIFIVYLS
jgi:hypothetical protein